MVVTVQPNVLPFTGGENEDRPPLGEVLRAEKLLRQNRGATADRIEDALADADPSRVLPEDAHQRLQRELGGELGRRARAITVLWRPQSMRVLILELIARPDVIEPRRLERARRLDDLLDRRIAGGERTERQGLGIESGHGGATLSPTAVVSHGWKLSAASPDRQADE